jgi:hypothetical protein
MTTAKPEKMPKQTEASMIELLHARYGTRGGNGPRYVGMAHVRSDAGFDAKRTADFMALDLWPSKGLVLHGHEVKISRSDWLNELKDPEKAGAFIPHVDYWWLVIADQAMVKAGELPDGWGMMAPGSDGALRVVKQAPRLRVTPLPPGVTPALHRGLVVAMLRSASKAANAQAARMTAEAMADFRAGHTLASETHTIDVWNSEARSYLPVATYTDLDDARAAHEAASPAMRGHLTTHRTYTYTETEWH